jgi:hypothetical protein
MRFLRPHVFLLVLLSFLSAVGLSASGGASKPSGKFLFQPQLLWGNSECTVQGTGYIIVHDKKYFGVTSIHFLDFNAGGLQSATWLEIPSEVPVATFRSSLGRPLRSAITLPQHVADDFVLMPLRTMPEDYTALQLEQVERYSTDTRLWFPNKRLDLEAGYEWIDATVIEDAGHLIRVRLRESVTLQSQSGSPVFNAETGKVVGMVQGGTDENGRTVLTLCPARSLVKHLGRRQQIFSLTTSIRRRR